MAFLSTPFGMAGRQSQQLEDDDTHSSNTTREDRDTTNGPSSLDGEPSNDAAPLYPDIHAQVPETVPEYPDLPNIEEIKQDGLALQDNLKRQHKELQQQAENLKKAESESRAHKAELDLETQAIQTEEEKLEQRKADHRNKQARQAEIDTNIEVLDQEWEQAKERFDNLKRKVQRLSNFTVNEATSPSRAVSSVEDDVATVQDAEDMPDFRAPTSNDGMSVGMPVPLQDLSPEDAHKICELWKQCTLIECTGPGQFVHPYCHECGANASRATDGTQPRFYGYLRGLKAHYDQYHPSHPPRSVRDVWDGCGKILLTSEDVDAIVQCNGTKEVQNTLRAAETLKSIKRNARLSRSRSTTPARSLIRSDSSTVAAIARKGTPKFGQHSVRPMDVGDTSVSGDGTKDG